MTTLRSAAAVGAALTDRQAEEALEQLLADPGLELSQRGRACLRFLAQAKFRGETKADPYLMATQLFGRGRDFSPLHDPIVRIEVARLRRALELYYETHGKTQCAQITIPHGSYIPCFVATHTARR